MSKDKKKSTEKNNEDSEFEISTELSISAAKPGCPEAELNFEISKEIFVIALILSLIQKGLDENEES